MKEEKQTVYMGGQSRLPKDLSQGEPFQVVVEFEPETAKVVEASFSPCLPIVSDFLRGLMIGINLETETEPVLEEISKRFRHRSQKAVIAAIRDMLREYKEFKYGVPKGPQSDMALI